MASRQTLRGGRLDAAQRRCRPELKGCCKCNTPRRKGQQSQGSEWRRCCKCNTPPCLGNRPARRVRETESASRLGWFWTFETLGAAGPRAKRDKTDSGCRFFGLKAGISATFPVSLMRKRPHFPYAARIVRRNVLPLYAIKVPKFWHVDPTGSPSRTYPQKSSSAAKPFCFAPSLSFLVFLASAEPSCFDWRDTKVLSFARLATPCEINGLGYAKDACKSICGKLSPCTNLTNRLRRFRLSASPSGRG